jgi:hypothetical protein
LCGGTGNCQTWILRRANGEWLNTFSGEAPIASSIGFVRQPGAVRDVVIGTHESAASALWTRYRFDGRSYRRAACYRVGPDSLSNVEELPCSH